MPPVIAAKKSARIVRLGAALVLLAVMCSSAVRAGDGPGDPPPAEGGHIGAQACKVCHNTEAKERRWDTWMNTKHADALETLKGEWSARIAKERGLAVPAYEAPECLRCHVTAYDAAQARPLARILPHEGVQCETCHGPGEAHQRDAQRAWVEKEAGVDVAAKIDLPDRSNCLQCHNAESPTWDPARYTLADGTTSGFDYAEAKRRAIHPEADMRPASKKP